MVSINSLHSPALLALGLLLARPAGAAQTVAPPQADKPALAVCADPFSLPYANDKQPGFENRIAELLAADQKADLHYTWYGASRGFLRRTLLAGACDVVIGIPSALPDPKIVMTKPYYAASYVAVTRAGDSRHFTSFDDAWLKTANIGVMLLGDDDATTPPQNALTSRVITQHITGFPMRSVHEVANPQGRIVDAVADGKIDVAFVWGPIAGYFAKPHGAALRLEPVTADPKNPELQFVYAMSMGVRKNDTALRDRLQDAIDRHRPEIAAILSSYGIPTVPLTEPHVQLSANVVAQKVGSPPPAH
jgi:quinoprotein dehydrogenase-associated probable ABC transporter substrate-binding protein